MGRWILLTSVAVMLSGCCGFGGGCGVGSPAGLLAWDGLSPEYSKPLPKRSVRIMRSKLTTSIKNTAEHPSEKDVELAALPKNSPEWWSLHDAINAEADAKLAKNLIICHGCLPSNSDDRTGSIK
jgi:hypothetical protein